MFKINKTYDFWDIQESCIDTNIDYYNEDFQEFEVCGTFVDKETKELFYWDFNFIKEVDWKFKLERTLNVYWEGWSFYINSLYDIEYIKEFFYDLSDEYTKQDFIEEDKEIILFVGKECWDEIKLERKNTHSLYKCINSATSL